MKGFFQFFFFSMCFFSIFQLKIENKQLITYFKLNYLLIIKILFFDDFKKY